MNCRLTAGSSPRHHPAASRRPCKCRPLGADVVSAIFVQDHEVVLKVRHEIFGLPVARQGSCSVLHGVVKLLGACPRLCLSTSVERNSSCSFWRSDAGKRPSLSSSIRSIAIIGARCSGLSTRHRSETLEAPRRGGFMPRATPVRGKHLRSASGKRFHVLLSAHSVLGSYSEVLAQRAWSSGSPSRDSDRGPHHVPASINAEGDPRPRLRPASRT